MHASIQTYNHTKFVYIMRSAYMQIYADIGIWKPMQLHSDGAGVTQSNYFKPKKHNSNQTVAAVQETKANALKC